MSLAANTIARLRGRIERAAAALSFATCLLIGATLPATLLAIDMGDIVVTDPGTSSVLIVDPTTGAQSVLTSGGFLSTPEAVEVNSQGEIFVVEGDRFGVGSKIVQVQAGDGTQSVLSSGGSLFDPNDIAIESDGTLVIADFTGPLGSGGIIRVDPSTGAQTVIYSGGNPAFNLAVEATGDIVFTHRNFFASPLLRLDIGSLIATLLTNDAGFAEGIAVEDDGHILVVDAGTAGGGIPQVLRIDPVTVSIDTLSSGGNFEYLRDIAVNAGGEIFVTQTTAIIRVDAVTGAQTVVSSGGNFNNLHGLTFFDAVPPVAIEARSWGSIKAAYAD